MYISPEAQRLLSDVEHAHRALIEHFRAGDAYRRQSLTPRVRRLLTHYFRLFRR